MSAVVPYVAASELDLRRFTVQVAQWAINPPNQLSMKIPDGQWWRPLIYQWALTTGAVVANRALLLQVSTTPGISAYQIVAPTTQPASLLAIYNYGPGLQAYSNLAVTGNAGQTAPTPDMILPAGASFVMTVSNFQVGDSLPVGGSVTYEQYVEVTDAEKRAARFASTSRPLFT